MYFKQYLLKQFIGRIDAKCYDPEIVPISIGKVIHSLHCIE